MEEKFVDLLGYAFENFIDTAIERGAEYKEIYDKQSDFAKSFFLGAVAIYLSKEEYLRIFSLADKVEKLNNN